MDERLSFPLETLFAQLGCTPVAATAARVVIDSRQCRAGDLFVAIEGARFDGHDFVAEVAERGAVAAVVRRRVAAALPQCIVADTRRALGRIAAWHRARLTPDAVIGVTGSNGKTTVKEMLAAVLQPAGPTLATQGNLNNDLGLPQMLLALTPAHRYAVLEMGANHEGEIDWLASLAQPDVGVITQAAEAHVGEFGGLEAIIRAKGELLDHIRPGGWAVLNADSPGFEAWRMRAAARGIRVVPCGRQVAPGTGVRIEQVRQTGGRVDVSLIDLAGQIRTLSLPLFGAHHAWNAALVVAVAQGLGLPWTQIATALARFRGAPGRLQPHALRGGGILLDDSYNANPASVRAAVAALRALPGQAVVCLGELAELGAQRDALLHDLGRWMKTQGVDRLLLLGGEATEAVAEGFGEGAASLRDHAAVVEVLAQSLQRASAPVNVLLKGSRCARMERILDGLRERHADLFV